MSDSNDSGYQSDHIDTEAEGEVEYVFEVELNNQVLTPFRLEVNSIFIPLFADHVSIEFYVHYGFESALVTINNNHDQIFQHLISRWVDQFVEIYKMSFVGNKVLLHEFDYGQF